ncbi:MAG: hypothetical protein A2V64_09550 [Bacteroidetes bacterium RBG_13_43_22]|nr:MAG: hypothetical protein A2V64_09550 [Bacteroidetes bacterium RBG_13_43_22]
MIRKLVILILFIRIFLPADLFPQVKSPFTGDPAKYRDELTLFMGPNLNDVQKTNLNSFLSAWDSSAFSRENMTGIIDIASQFSARSMRPVPHFNDFFITLKAFNDKENQEEILGNWLTGLSEMLFNPRFSTDRIARYIKNTGMMISNNVLSESTAIQWKVKGNPLKFLHDTVFYVEITNSTLTCYSQKDSTEIYNATGYYFPEIQQFHGKKGIITWEKAGYDRENVFAEIENYNINIAKNSFTVDSAKLNHKTYFKTPVYGLLSDQSITFKNKERANFPRFETYIKEFRLDNIYQGVNYEGGLTFEGATVKGAGTQLTPARITLLRNDTLYLRIQSDEFIFSKNGLNSSETSISLYLDADSIFHSNLGFSYNVEMRQVNLFRGNNPVSRSPYFDSFHNLDMYFEYLSWNMNESRIVLSRARGAALGQAQFESASFFDANYFMRLAGMDDYHPLVMLKRFADWYYSETFPVEEFAKWMNRPVEAVTSLCIDMANRGFVFYNRKYNEITLKKKVNDFLESYAKRKDYDVLSIASETKAPVDNAILDLHNFRLTVNGVNGVYLSDSQRVAVYPYGQRVVIGKNRSMEFDGVVEAGLFTVFGHNFSFSYDTFKIRLEKIDSIKIAVETDRKDDYGNPIIKEVDNLIQLGTAELYIDDPNNKSGLRSLRQYPIINAVTFSYIFFDKIPGLEGVYPQQDFYFKVDPFTYENIDHYTNEDMNLVGEFVAGNILKPTRQYLTIQENNSLGFNMVIPEEGVDVYGDKGVLYENINMSNRGLIGGGSLKHLTSTTVSEEFKFYPDSMVTQAVSFNIDKDVSGFFPSVHSEDVDIKWLTRKDEWMASNADGKNFEMFDNGTLLDGNLTLTPAVLKGSGIINTTDSRVTSDLFSFASGQIKADTSMYNLKSPSTSGYAFIAENVRTDINFDLQTTQFHLNTDTSVVKFPEIQYICTMTDFTYNMTTKILNMEQKGKKDTELMQPDKLLALDFANLDKPTFFATNVIKDTIAFTSFKGSYHLNEEYIEAENINYIHIADALIQPEKGKITINRRAKIQQLQNAVVAVNNRHILHTAKIDIESTKRYFGSAIYDYVDENKEIQQISFAEVTVDTMATSARGYIPVSQKFMLSPDFTFAGDVNLYASKEQLSFTGSAGIIHRCDKLASYPVKFKAYIDPKNVMIPISEKPRDANDNMIFSGSFLNIDSIHIYPTFLSAQKSWTDANLVSSQGFLYFDKARSRYVITSREKLADLSLNGNLVAYDRNYCILSSEGRLNFGTNYDLVKMTSAGKVIHTVDSGDVNIDAILAFDFHFSVEALKMMSDEIRMVPTLKPVNLSSEMYIKGMKDLIGTEAASQMKEELDLFGTSRNLPREFNFELLLNDVKLYWNESSSSFRSSGPIGIGFIGTQPINVYVDGFIEIQRRRSGDMFDIYLKANESTWYYFSYIRGNMMTQAFNINYNSLIANTKQNLRKHPDASVRVPYTYMIAVEDRLGRFLQRMRGESSELTP